FRRQWSKAINHFSGKCFALLLAVEISETAIERQSHREIGDVLFWNKNRDAHIDLRRPRLAADSLLRAITQRRNRLFQHRLVKFEADFANVTRLLFTQQIPAPAHVEIVAGQCETRAEIVERG